MSAQQPSIAFSGNIPANYDQYLGPLFFEPFSLDVAQRISVLKPRKVLEVAGGTGRLTRHLAESLPATSEIFATDLNPAMVSFAKEHLNRYDNIRWDVVDAVSLPYRDQTFDCIVSQFGVMFYSDRPAAYAEALRTLKPGGVFLFTAWDEIQVNPAALLTHQALAHFFPVDTPAFYQVPFSYFDEHLVRYDLAKAGFEQVHSMTLQLTGFSDTAENAAVGLLEGTPAYTAIVERDATLLKPLRQYLAAELSRQFGAENLHVPLQARLYMAMRNA